MKNRIIAALLLASMLALTTSCSNGTTTENNTETDSSAVETTGDTAAVSSEAYNYMGNDLSPYITVGNYKGLSATIESKELTDAEYDAELASLMDSYSYYEQIIDRAVAEGETVITSYTGYLNGEPFEGGSAEGASVTAADGNGYIDGFGTAFVGQTPGVEFSFDVTFPTVYGNLDLAGKEVTFVCTIDYIQGDTLITPELNDAFVLENFGYETVAEFETMFREYTGQQKAYSIENEMYNDLWAQVMDASVVKSYPAGEVDRNYNESKAMYEAYASMYGVEYDDFLTNYIGATDDDIRFQAEYIVKENLVMYQLVKDMGIVIDETKFNEEVASIAEMYGVTSDEMLSYYGRDALMASILWQEVMLVITEAADIATN